MSQPSTAIEQKFSRVVGLGIDCRVRYQISRSLYHRQPPEKRTEAFEKALYATARATTPHGTFFFDWLVSPAKAVARCLNDDFKSVFQRQNLAINAAGSAFDKEYGIVFQHAFSRVEGKVTDAVIEKEYEAQKVKFDYLADKTLANFSEAEPTLYVIAGAAASDLGAVREAIDNKQPAHPYHVLAVRGDQTTRGFVEVTDTHSVYVMTQQVNKPATHRWQGDDGEWSALLDPIAISPRE
ncbi:MAG TPA: hypothetical protein VJR58_22370 [Vineibacter sp.]|nr:hypothetical protein [Vineibacter sp.]